MHEDDTLTRPCRRLTFDPTINAGHLLTFGGMVVAIFLSWNLMDKRVTVLEEAKTYQQFRDNQQDARTIERLGEIKEGIKDLKTAVQRLDQKVRP